MKTRIELDSGVAGREDEPLLQSPDENEDNASEPLLSSRHEASEQEVHPITAGVATLSEAYNTALSRATSRISSQGIALGYAAGILLLVIALVPVTLLHGTTFSLRLAIGLSGIWWAVFSLPAAAWLPSGKKTKEVRVEGEEAWGAEDDSKEEWSTGKEIVKAWKRLGNMLRWREVKKLRNTFKFLAAWFLLSDGVPHLYPSRITSDQFQCGLGFTTITSTAMLFAKTSLNMPATSLVIIGIITPLAGIIGSLVWPVLQRCLGWSNLRVLVTLVCLASFLPAYGCLGFLSVFREGRVRFGGLTTPAEMYALAVYFVS